MTHGTWQLPVGSTPATYSRGADLDGQEPECSKRPGLGGRLRGVMHTRIQAKSQSDRAPTLQAAVAHCTVHLPCTAALHNKNSNCTFQGCCGFRSRRALLDSCAAQPIGPLSPDARGWRVWLVVELDESLQPGRDDVRRQARAPLALHLVLLKRGRERASDERAGGGGSSSKAPAQHGVRVM